MLYYITGVCPAFDGLDVCHGCKEWCWLSGVADKYERCTEDSQCASVRRNACSSMCTF